MVEGSDRFCHERDVRRLRREALQEIARLWALARVLHDALEPFAEAADDVDEKDRDEWHAWEHPAAMDIKLGDLRKAKALFAVATEALQVGTPLKSSSTAEVSNKGRDSMAQDDM